MLWFLICALLAGYIAAEQSVLVKGEGEQHAPVSKFPDFAFSEKWLILGPFQVGTRETPWSSDPLEFHADGGFHALPYDPEASFRSALAYNGSVYWINETAHISRPHPQYSRASIHVDFWPTIDWPFLQDVYGWAGHQWQGWARGEIFIQSKKTKTLILDVNNIIEYWVDGSRYYGGDFYSYGRAYLTLHLEPGVHTIDIKIVGDVRSAGGVGSPTVDVALELRETSHELSLLYHEDLCVMMADIVGGEFGNLVSPYAAITVRNDALHDIYVHRFEGMANLCEVELLNKGPIKVVPGQTRPIAFRIGCVPSYNRRIRLYLKYNIEGEMGERDVVVTHWPNIVQDIDAIHKITYLHPSGIVSWGTLRPPSLDAACGEHSNATIPVMPSLHGAGVRVDDLPQLHMFDQVPDLCVWIVFPQGTTGWSGDDWHSWGLADTEAAINSIPQWIEAVEWQRQGVDVDRWLMVGHSNGGQGSWYALTHRPDKIFAAAVLSGYSSIQNYVPYTSWRTVDPGREAIVQGSMSSYRHDFLTDNTQGTPIIIQHGSKDDNVPAYHSRLMNLRIFEGHGDCAYHEVPDEPHFWDGVAATLPMKAFFEKYLDNLPAAESETSFKFSSFSIVVADPGGMGTKNGVQVLQLVRPGQVGRVDFKVDPETKHCNFRLSNIAEFTVPPPYEECEELLISGQQVVTASTAVRHGHFVQRDRRWTLMDAETNSARSWQQHRSGRQLGQIDSILRTTAAFQIVRHSKETEQVALQVSRNLAQYFAADTEITDDYDAALAAEGNIISISIDGDFPDGDDKDHPIRVKDGVKIRDRDGYRAYYSEDRKRLGAIFLRPLPNERLQLVVWGKDLKSLTMAARLVPMMTGSGQPDWVVMDESMMWKGLDGTLALGFFDQDWGISRHAYFT